MKITIKKFMELTNVNIETPAKIEAPHEGGKSTIFRAVLFAVTGKDMDGKEFDGRIYPKNSQMLSDLTAEVEIEQAGIVFNKQAKGSEKREKGSEETTLQKSVTNVYSIDYKVVNKSEYDAKISETFGNFHLFSNPDYFRNLKKDEKRAIFSSLVKIDKESYFDGLSDKKTVSGKIKAQNELIASTNSKLDELSKVQEPEKIEVVDYETQLSELRAQREKAEPKFSPDHLRENETINGQISDLEKMVFEPKQLIPLLPEPEKPVLIDVDELKKELEKIQLSEPETNFIDTQIERMKFKIQQIKSLSLQIENYDDNVKNAKCTRCQVCTVPDCPFKQIEVTPLDELQSELSKYMTLKEAEKTLANFESQKIDYLRSFDEKKESEILRLQNEISEGVESNKKTSKEHAEKMTNWVEENGKIKTQNSEIQKTNSEKAANFETDKSKKIAELKSQLHTLPAFDYSEFDEQIRKIELLNNAQQVHVKAYNELNGAWIYAKNRIVELTDELQKQKQALYYGERELIKIKDAENRYYNDFESLINSEMPENIKVNLFKKNLSNDDYSEVFEIEFNGSIYAGNGKTIAFYIWLCSWFQFKFGKDLPIFIDEAIILNESLYREVKNTVILMRNDECKQLKITNVN